MKKTLLIVGGGLLLFLGGAWLSKNIATKDIVGEKFRIVSREHIPEGSEHEAYNSNPPTSGPHYDQPARNGFYIEELPDERVVHNLEHGSIWVTYKDIDEATLESLQRLAQQYSGRLIVTPRDANETPLAVASWGRMTALHDYDEEIILAYLKNNVNNSPEKLSQ